MNLDDVLKARLRTVWPLIVGHVAALLAWLTLRAFGIQVDQAAMIEVASLLLTWGAWEVGRRLEASGNNLLAGIGRWLISAGIAVGPPAYGEDARSVSETEATYWTDGSVRSIRTRTDYRRPAGHATTDEDAT